MCIHIHTHTYLYIYFSSSAVSGGAGQKQNPLKTVVPKARNLTPSKHTGQCKIISVHMETLSFDLNCNNLPSVNKNPAPI